MCNNDTFTTKYKVQRYIYITYYYIGTNVAKGRERERDAARASPLTSPPIESTHVDDVGTRKGKEKYVTLLLLSLSMFK